MEAGRDFLLFIGFLIVLGIAWYATSGPSKTTFQQGWFLSPPAPLGSGESYNIPSVPLFTGGARSPSSEGSEESGTKPTVWDYLFGFRAGTGTSSLAKSPYAPYVQFQQAQARSANPATEYVLLKTSQNLKTNITVTGWRLESAATGLSVTIGEAVRIPFLGEVNYEEPVSVGSNTYVVVTTGRSPNGVSFRLNKCTGYFEQFQDFSPTLPRDCPTPEEEAVASPEVLGANDACHEFIETIPDCTLTVTAIPGNIGAQCQDFVLNTLSYSSCIAEHKNDPDFYSASWRVFLERDQELWKNTHDAIRLLDEDGKLVGQVSY